MFGRCSAPRVATFFLVSLLVRGAAVAAGSSEWCSDPTRGAYFDVHVHGSSAPMDFKTYEQFLETVEVLHADAVANGYSANLIVNLPAARWWYFQIPEELKSNIVITGFVRPYARNEGERIAGFRYPDVEGDPVIHINLFARLGARAIKLHASSAQAVGLGKRQEIRHCARFDDWSVRPPYPQPVDPSYKIVDCAGYGDDQVPLGPRGEVFLDYLMRAAALGLNVMVHGDERYGDGTRTFMGVDALAEAVARVRAESPEFQLLMLHGPQERARMLAGSGARILAQEGLFWETSSRRVAEAATEYALALAEGDLDAQEQAIGKFEAFLGDLYDEPGIADRFIFGSDVGNPLGRLERSMETFVLQRDTFARPESPFAGEDPAVLFCERGAAFLGLP